MLYEIERVQLVLDHVDDDVVEDDFVVGSVSFPQPLPFADSCHACGARPP
jgi:hypothetical protein